MHLPVTLIKQCDNVFAFSWQLVENCLFAGVLSKIKNGGKEFEGNFSLICFYNTVLLESGENLSDLIKLPTEDILLRWFNYHLKNSDCKSMITNFSTDVQVYFVLIHVIFKNCEYYHYLLHQIKPAIFNLTGLKEEGETSAAKILQNARQLNCGKYLLPKHITEVVTSYYN